MKKLLVAMLAVSLLVGALSGAVLAEAARTPVRKIIIDTDTGADDASALILAAMNPEVEIVGVTVLAGNVDLEQGTKNALAALEIAGSDAPVYKGSDACYDGAAISPYSVFGSDGMGDMDLVHPRGQAQTGDAIDFILDTVRDSSTSTYCAWRGARADLPLIGRDLYCFSHGISGKISAERRTGAAERPGQADCERRSLCGRMG